MLQSDQCNSMLLRVWVMVGSELTEHKWRILNCLLSFTRSIRKDMKNSSHVPHARAVAEVWWCFWVRMIWIVPFINLNKQGWQVGNWCRWDSWFPWPGYRISEATPSQAIVWLKRSMAAWSSLNMGFGLSRSLAISGGWFHIEIIYCGKFS